MTFIPAGRSVAQADMVYQRDAHLSPCITAIASVMASRFAVQFDCHTLWYNEVMARGWESKAVEAQIG